MLSAKRQPGVIGPDVGGMMTPPAPMQFAAPPQLPPPDATGHQAIGGLAQLATALQSRLTQRPPTGAGGGPTDAPRRKVPFSSAAANSA